jgi:hypothetical protein
VSQRLALYTEVVQLAFLGKIGEHAAEALELVSFCFDELAVSRVIYVGGDDTAERALTSDSTRPAGLDLTSGGFWRRSLEAIHSSPLDLAAFIAKEQRLLSLLRLETVEREMSPFTSPVIASWGSYTVRASLTDNTQAAASTNELLVLGSNHGAHLPDVSEALRFAPGPLAEAGLLVLCLSDDTRPTIEARVHDRHRACQRSCRLHLTG